VKSDGLKNKMELPITNNQLPITKESADDHGKIRPTAHHQAMWLTI